MAKSVVNPEFKASADRVYAAGGFRPRRKGERRVPYEVVPDFPNQQGEVHADMEICPNTFVSVKRLGTFDGYDHYSRPCKYRAFRAELSNGLIVPMFSHDADQYVMCLHTGYKLA